MLERSGWLQAQVDEHATFVNDDEEGKGRQELDLRKTARFPDPDVFDAIPDPFEAFQDVFDACLVWLYTRSFALVLDGVQHSFGDDFLISGLVDLFEFAVNTNEPRWGYEDTERENDELIKILGEKISQLFKDSIEGLVKDTVEGKYLRPVDVAIDIRQLYQVDGKDEHAVSLVKGLQKQVAGHIAFRGALAKKGLKDVWDDLLEVCEGFQGHLLDQFMESVDNSDLSKDMEEDD